MNVKRLLIGIVLILLVGVFGVLVGCGLQTNSSSTESQPSSNIETLGKYSATVYDFVDEETGVHYLIYTMGGYRGGITVRYNADGTIMVDD